MERERGPRTGLQNCSKIVKTLMQTFGAHENELVVRTLIIFPCQWVYKLGKAWAAVMALFTQRSLPTLEVRGSNPVIGKL